jgi:hypothetical protein
VVTVTTFEHIFIQSAATREQLADELAAALHLDVERPDETRIVLSRPANADASFQVGGDLGVNFYTDASEDREYESVIDGYQYVWELGYTGHDDAIQETEANALFLDLAACRRWPALLLKGLDLLVAAWGPEAGLRVYTPRVSPDADQRALWQAYDTVPGRSHRPTR